MTELAALLEAAQAASPRHRIEWRDRIAAFGLPAIDAMRPWLIDPILAAFAIRVIERVGLEGAPALATKVLRASRASVPATTTIDVDRAIQHLRAQSAASRPSRS